MKAILIPLALASSLAPCLGQTNSTTATFQTSGDPSKDAQASSTSVTVTSDGQTTIKKTVTVIDGVRTVVIETTDENGETTRTKSGDKPEQTGTTPWIGLKVSEFPAILRDQLGLAEDEGLAVDLVAEEGPAMKAGMQKGDLLLRLEDKGVSSEEALSEGLANHQPGDEVTVVTMRKGQRSELKIKLAKAPAKSPKVVPEALLDELEKPSIKSVEVDVTGEGFDGLLNNPDLPENLKETIREMQKSLREFEKKKE